MWGRRRESGREAKLCEARVKCAEYTENYTKLLDGLASLPGSRAAPYCHYLSFPIYSPFHSPPSANQLQLHCELNCNEAHAAAKYENERRKRAKSKAEMSIESVWSRGTIRVGRSIRNISPEMAINSYVCFTDTLQTVLMMASPSHRRKTIFRRGGGPGLHRKASSRSVGCGGGVGAVVSVTNKVLLFPLTRQSGRQTGSFRFIRLIGCNGSSRNFQDDDVAQFQVKLRGRSSIAFSHHSALPNPPTCIYNTCTSCGLVTVYAVDVVAACWIMRDSFGEIKANIGGMR